MAQVDDQRIGRISKALRHRLGWRQKDLAARVGYAQTTISLVERGHFEQLSVRTVRRIAAALDATLVVEMRWRGAAVDRLVDDAHAALVAAVAAYLAELGWHVEVEVTYSEFGERGSFDLLAFHPDGTLLVVEVKTDLPSGEATLRKLDEKARLAPSIALKRFGWGARVVGRLVVMPESATLRRRVVRHATLFDRVLPTRNVGVRRWIARPDGALAGLWFFADSNGLTANSGPRHRERVRRSETPRKSTTTAE